MFAALKCISQTSQKLAEGFYKIHHTTVFTLQWIKLYKTDHVFSIFVCPGHVKRTVWSSIRLKGVILDYVSKIGGVNGNPEVLS